MTASPRAAYAAAYYPVPPFPTTTSAAGAYAPGPASPSRGYFVLIRTTSSLGTFEVADETLGVWKNSDLSSIMATSAVEVQWTSLESMADMLQIYSEFALIEFLMKDV